MEKVEEVLGFAYDEMGGDPLHFSHLHMVEVAGEAVPYGPKEGHQVCWEVSNR